MDQNKLETILGRPEHAELIELAKSEFPDFYKGYPILVTGGNGSLGNALADWFDDVGVNSYHLLDVELSQTKPGRRVHYCDIMDAADMRYWVKNTNASYVFHFAAAKHAPVGEEKPLETMRLNVEGTQNIISALEQFGGEDARLVLSSTCKSIQPETAYGASKLIADRLILNAGYSVARYFNVVQSSGNVFEIWDAQEPPYQVTECGRYFISMDEAIALTLYTGIAASGRYCLDPARRRNMEDIAMDLFGEEYEIIPARRGDRINEPFAGPNEYVENAYSSIYKVINYNDKMQPALHSE